MLKLKQMKRAKLKLKSLSYYIQFHSDVKQLGKIQHFHPIQFVYNGDTSIEFKFIPVFFYIGQ